MTLIGDWADISQDHSVPNGIEAQNLIGFRACLGASITDQDYPAQLAEAKRRNPGIVTLDYTFLAGPKRSHSAIADQVIYYAQRHKADLSCIDWERDTYVDPQTRETIDLGIQPFPFVLSMVRALRKSGLNPGVYGFKAEFTSSVVSQLIAARVPFLWVAAFGGLTLDPWLIEACAKAGVLLFHQYTGDRLDRSRTLVGSLERLHELAGRETPAAEGEPLTNLVPLTAHRVVDIPADKVLVKTPGGDIYTHLNKAVTLGLLGATATHYHVADGDAGVYVKRTDVSAVRTADISVGA